MTSGFVKHDYWYFGMQTGTKWEAAIFHQQEIALLMAMVRNIRQQQEQQQQQQHPYRLYNMGLALSCPHRIVFIPHYLKWDVVLLEDYCSRAQ